MSVTPTTNYLSYAGLQKYDELIKGWVRDAEGEIKITNTHFTVPAGQTAATLEDAIGQLVDEQADAKIVIQETAGTTTDLYAKKYTIWTGDIKPGEADPYADATKIGDIDIPKDFTLLDAEVKVVATEDDPVEGYKVGQKYIDFTVNAKEAADPTKLKHMYILVDDLVKPFTVEEDAEQVQIAISATNELSATLVDGGVDLDALAQEVKDDYAIDVTITAGGDSDAFAQKVVISQGVNEDGDPVEKATLEIPKDCYVESGTCEYLNADAIAAIDDAEGTAPTVAGYYIKLALANKDKTVYVPVSSIAAGFSVLNTHDVEGVATANSVTLTKDTTDPTDAKLSAEITDGGVTTVKIADDAVTNEKLADDAVDTDQVKDSAITLDKLSDTVLEELPGIIPLTGENSIESLFADPVTP